MTPETFSCHKKIYELACTHTKSSQINFETDEIAFKVCGIVTLPVMWQFHSLPSLFHSSTVSMRLPLFRVDRVEGRGTARVQTFSVSCRAEQLHFRVQQCVVATVESSLLSRLRTRYWTRRWRIITEMRSGLLVSGRHSLSLVSV
jgi:hypothetical protein